MTQRLYREFADQAALDAEYNLVAAVPDAPAYFANWDKQSAQMAQSSNALLGQAFGPTRAEYLDIYPSPMPKAPVHIFVHGGYWRRFSARDHGFIAKGLNAAGFSAVIVNYALCPWVTIDEIVRQVRASVAWTYDHIAKFGGDPERITISGHSAGGHLTAMALLTDWQGDYGRPANLIKAAMPVSGVFDLTPLPYTYLQPSLQLSCSQIQRCSPQLFDGPARPPIDVVVGADETAEFRRQSDALAAHWSANNAAIACHHIAGRHHFSILDDFADPASTIGQILQRYAQL